uniref:Uncharacterized protein n=1 Tax=Brassica oleracea var. oleracea TaxID=109376 RepID=A0A0D3BG44_BRAOL
MTHSFLERIGQPERPSLAYARSLHSDRAWLELGRYGEIASSFYSNHTIIDLLVADCTKDTKLDRPVNYVTLAEN